MAGKAGCFEYEVYQVKIITELKRLANGEDPFKYKWEGFATVVGQSASGGGGGKMGDFVFTGKDGKEVAKVEVLYSDINKTKDITNELENYNAKDTIMRRFKECVNKQQTTTTSPLEIDGGNCSMAKDSEYTWIGSPEETKEDTNTKHWGFIFKNKTGEIYYNALLKVRFTDFITSKLKKITAKPSAPSAPSEEENKKTTLDEKLKKAEADLEKLDGQSTSDKNSATAIKTRLKLKAEIELLKKKKAKKKVTGGGRRRTRRKRRRRKKKKTVRRKKKRRTKRKRKRVKRKTRRRR